MVSLDKVTDNLIEGYDRRMISHDVIFLKIPNWISLNRNKEYNHFYILLINLLIIYYYFFLFRNILWLGSELENGNVKVLGVGLKHWKR